MKRNLLLTAWLFAIIITAHADGPGAYRPRPGLPAATAERSAIDAYHDGYMLVQRADNAEILAATATDEAERNSLQREAHDAYRASLAKLEAAIRFDSSMHEARTYLGYANRKLGRYEDALRAYEQALRINADYPRAIEYQGEAFLGLNRIDEARFNYLRLYALDRRQASKLFLAMQAWLEANTDDPPAGIDMDSLAAWIAQRASSSESNAADNAAAVW